MPRFEQHRPWRKLYGRQWRKARELYLRGHPLCRMCEAQGTVTPATVVDHKREHKGDVALFWDMTNWQGLCDTHHNRDKQSEERGPGICRADGYPANGDW